MARKRKVPPHTTLLLCDHITSKTNTTANIGVHCESAKTRHSTHVDNFV